MELEGVEERVGWEARRVAAAFGVAQRKQVGFDSSWQLSGITSGALLLTAFVHQNGAWYGLIVSPSDGCHAQECVVWEARLAEHPLAAHRMLCHTIQSSPCNELMAHGLYRLGFEDEGVLAKLNYPLSAHEKLELRRSLPREFWPQKWINEEEKNAAKQSRALV